MLLDSSIGDADHDGQTTNRDGTPIFEAIDGVLFRMPIVHTDHRGRLFEVYQGTAGDDGFWTKPVVYSYVFTVRTSQVKGWGLHQKKDDRYTIITGELMTVLYDARIKSPTHGVVQKVVLGGSGARQLLIPAGVWHINVNLGDVEAHLINHPTEVYQHDAPDRLLLPWNTPAIPFPLADYFPVQK